MGVRFIKGINGSEKIKFLKSAVINNDNSALLLHMDGESGSNTFIDSSSNNFAVTANGDAQISTAEKKFGNGAAYFDGDGDYLELPVNAIQFDADDFTIEFWVYPTRTGSHTCIANWRCGVSMTIFLAVDTDEGVVVYLNGTGPYIVGGSIQANQWQHVALVRDGVNMKAYINGIEVATYNIGSTPINTITENIRIGADYDCNTKLEGYIDELRITKGAAIYTADFDPPTAPFGNTIVKNKIRFIKPNIDPTTWLSVFNKVGGIDTFANIYNNQTVVTFNGSIFFDYEDYYLRLLNGFGVNQIIFQSLGGNYNSLDLILSNEMPLLQSLSFAGCGYGTFTITAPNGTNASALNFNGCGYEGNYFIFNPTADLANISSLNITNSNSSYNFTINDISVMTNLSTFTLNGDIIPDAAGRNFYIGGMSTPMHANKVLMVLQAVYESTVENTFWVDPFNEAVGACYAANDVYQDCLNNLDNCLSSADDCRYDYNECLGEKAACENNCDSNYLDSDDPDWNGYYNCIDSCNDNYQCNNDFGYGGSGCNDIEDQCYIDYDCGNFYLGDCINDIDVGQYSSSYVIQLKVLNSTYTGAVVDDIQDYKASLEARNLTVNLTFV